MSAGIKVLYKSTSFIDVLQAFKELKPNHVCIRVAENAVTTDYTYSSLWAKACESARKIASCTKLGDRILLPMPTSPEFIEAFFGCVLSGRIPVPLPVERSGSRFSRMDGVLKDCEPTLAIFKNQADLAGVVESLGGLHSVVLREMSPPPESGDAIIAGNASKIMFIQYTSGSTSNPKGVVLTHGNLLANLRMIQQGMQTPEAEVSVSWLPLHHDMGLIGNLLLLVSVGGLAYVYPYQEFARNPISWLDAITKQRGTLAGCPNFGYAAVAKRLREAAATFDLSSMRLMYCGSERIAPDVIRSFFEALESSRLNPSAFFPCYGLAEASLYVSGAFENPFDLPQIKIAGSSYPTCGFVAAGLLVRVTNESGKAPAPGEVGEIEISGPSVSVGYWKHIASQVQAGQYIETAPKYLKTGDLGCLHQNQVVITGRSKDVIKINGRNVYPEDVELLLERESDWFGSNATVAVRSSRPNQSTEGLTIFAEVMRTRRAGPFEPMLLQIQASLAEADLRCERLIVVSPGSLPKTSSGKKQRSKTVAMFETDALKILWDSKPIAESDVICADPVQTRLGHLATYMASIDLVLCDERRSFPSDFVNQLRRADVLGLLIPRELGGAGLTSAQFAALARGMGRLDVTLGAFVGIQNTIGTLPILKSDHYKDKNFVLEDIAKNGAITAFAITEPGAGSNPRALLASAKPKDGKFVLSGEKIWIGNAELAQYVCVFVKELDLEGREVGISAFLLRKDRHKFKVTSEQLTVGLRSMPQNRIILDGCELSHDDRLSVAGEGLRLAFASMEYARFGLAALAIGTMETVGERSLSYAKNRDIWTGKLAENGFYKETLTEHQSRIESLSALVDTCAEFLASTDSLPTAASLSAKILCGEWTFLASDLAMQFSGGRGYTETFGLGRIWRDARILRIFEGPTETLAFQLGSSVLRNSSGVFRELGLRSSPAIERFAAICDAYNNGPSAPNPAASTAVHVGCTAATLIALATMAQRQPSRAAHANLFSDLELDTLEIKLKRASILSQQPDSTYSSITSGPDLDTNRKLYDQWNGVSDEAQRSPEKNIFSLADENASSLDVNSKNISSSDADEVRQGLRKWLTTFTRVKHIDDAISMAAYGLDSLLGYELLCFVEETYAVTLPEALVAKKPSVDELVTLICKTRIEGHQS